MIKVIGFDFGDVLVKDTLKAIKRKYKWNKLSKDKAEKLRNAISATHKGKATEDQMIEVLHEVLAPQLTIRQIKTFLHTSKILPPWKLLQKVAKDYPIAIVTNNYRQGPQEFARRLHMNLKPYQIINSAYVGVRKPHADYYKEVLRRLKIKPSELLFIDDVEDNVKGAQKVGITAFRYDKNMPELRAFMKKHGIKV